MFWFHDRNWGEMLGGLTGFLLNILQSFTILWRPLCMHWAQGWHVSNVLLLLSIITGIVSLISSALCLSNHLSDVWSVPKSLDCQNFCPWEITLTLKSNWPTYFILYVNILKRGANLIQVLTDRKPLLHSPSPHLLRKI